MVFRAPSGCEVGAITTSSSSYNFSAVRRGRSVGAKPIPKIKCSAFHARLELVAGHFASADPDSRMSPAERHQQGWQEARVDCLNDADREMAGAQSPQLSDRGTGLFNFTQDAPNVGKESFTGRGKRHLFPDTIRQRASERLLKLADLRGRSRRLG